MYRIRDYKIENLPVVAAFRRAAQDENWSLEERTALGDIADRIERGELQSKKSEYISKNSGFVYQVRDFIFILHAHDRGFSCSRCPFDYGGLDEADYKNI